MLWLIVMGVMWIVVSILVAVIVAAGIAHAEAIARADIQRQDRLPRPVPGTPR